MVRQSWLRGRGVEWQSLVDGRLARARMSLICGDILSVYVVHLEGEDQSLSAKLLLLDSMACAMRDDKGFKMIVGDLNFEPAVLSTKPSQSHRRLEMRFREALPEMSLLSSEFASHLGSVKGDSRVLDHVGLAIPPAVLSLFDVTMTTLELERVIGPPRLSDHVPILFSIQMRGGAKNPLPKIVAKKGAWVSCAKEVFGRLLSTATSDSERIAAVEAACSRACIMTRDDGFGWVDWSNAEHNLYFLRVALRLLVQGRLERLSALFKAAKHWKLKIKQRGLIETLDAMIYRAAVRVADVKDSLLSSNRSAAEQRKLTTQKQKWAFLFSLWRSRVVRPQLAALTIEGSVCTNAERMAESLAAHWRCVAKPDELPLAQEEASVLELVPAVVWPPPPQVSPEEMCERLRHAPVTAPGPDGVGYVHLFSLGSALYDLASQLFEGWIESGAWPPSLSYSWLVAIPKGASFAPSPDEVRPIALTDCLSKLLTSSLARWLYGVLPQHICDRQFGFLPNRGTEGALMMLEHSVLGGGLDDGDAACLFLDIKRAFPTVSHRFLHRVLEAAGAPQWLRNALLSLYQDLNAAFRVKSYVSKPFTLQRGLRQGCPLSGILFAFLSDPLIRWASMNLPPQSSVVGFADDLAMVVARIRGEGSMCVLRFVHLLSSVAGLRLNYGKVCGLALSGAVIGSVFLLLAEHDSRWAQAQEKEFVRYLGFQVGHLDRDSMWEPLINKMWSRSEVVNTVSIGAPALIRLAQAVLWALGNHLLALFEPSPDLKVNFSRMTSALFKGPRGWLPTGVREALGHAGWRPLPPDVRELSFRLRLKSLIRHPEWLIASRFDAVRKAVYADSSPLRPFLAKWFECSATKSLWGVAQICILHGAMELDGCGGAIWKARLAGLLVKPKKFNERVRGLLVRARILEESPPEVVRAWLTRRLRIVMGPEWDSWNAAERVRQHLILLGSIGPPRLLNAATRIVTEGVLLSSPCGFSGRCLLCPTCAGENSLSHYVRSSCWKGSLLRRFSLGLDFPGVLRRNPDKRRTLQWGWACYFLVKALNWARFKTREERLFDVVTLVQRI